MGNNIQSYEYERLKKLIDAKKAYLKSGKCTSSTAKMIQSEILFLENSILPIIAYSTMLYHAEFVNYVLRCLDAAVTMGCNSIYIYYPINTNYKGRLLVGVANHTESQPYGTSGKASFSIEAVTLDGTSNSIGCVQIQLNPLI